MLLKRLRSLFRRRRMERELDAELRFHVDMQVAEYVRQGMSPDEARRTVRQLFGVVDRVKDDVRDTWLTRFVETLCQDARYSLRSLGKQRGYAAAVIVTMALGIGANSAVFSVVNAVVLQPLPYARGDDLLLLRQPRGQFDHVGFSLDDIADLKARVRSFDAVVEYHDMYFILLGGEEPARVSTGVVSWDYFEALGIAPHLGRTFAADDDRPESPAALVISYEYWQRAFHGDASVVGRVFQMNDRPHTVVGVLPNVPMYPQPNDVYMPRSACPFRMNPPTGGFRRGVGMGSAIARRRPGVSIEEAQADLASTSDRLHEEFARDYLPGTGRVTSVPLRREFSRNFESTLAILLSTAGFVLLIVCASVANLSVARTMRRERELTLRTSLGATRMRLVRQVLTENVMLSIAGGAAGLLLAAVAMDLLVGYAERFTLRAGEIRIDRSVFLFTLGVSLATGLLSGILPTLSRRFLFVPGISRTNRSPLPRSDLRRALIVAQVAASFMLLVGAGLLLRSLIKLTLVDPGFSSDHVLTMQIDVNFSKYGDRFQRAEYLDRLLTRLREIPGVSKVGASGTIPFLEQSGGYMDRFVVENGSVSPDNAPPASLHIASEDYFRAMRIPLLDGRFFTADDNLSSPLVIIVNRTLAQRYWPNGNAVGQRISPDGRNWRTIVGVVADVRQRLAEAPVDEIYSPMRQAPYLSTHWIIRAAASPDELAPAVRQAVHSVDPDQPIEEMRPLDVVRAASLVPPRLTATLIGIFAGIALLITASGIAGVIAFSVTQRTHEFGLRVALGARRADVVTLVLSEGIRLALAGLAIGVVGALFLGGLLSTALFGVEPTDATTYVAVSSMLLIVAGLACLLPALRAASIDPMQALRVA
jgi:predicted permease